jgi:NAD(P)-dependent dehydrogenase (short-subunit alcohol dehydrogenase family)
LRRRRAGVRIHGHASSVLGSIFAALSSLARQYSPVLRPDMAPMDKITSPNDTLFTRAEYQSSFGENLSSLAGRKATRGLPSYSPSKAALEGLSRQVAVDYSC